VKNEFGIDRTGIKVGYIDRKEMKYCVLTTTNL